ncbi:ABC transporter permease [Aestuariivirga sp.]|uniref:ABC transporter permease n=1 Tax=Aestuariivirga sp. TaxID=2650926 RepID=UPI0039E3D5FB
MTAVPEHVTPDGFFRSLVLGFRRQRNVVFALIFKDFVTSASKRYAISLLWVMIEPAVQTLAMCLFWYMLRRPEVSGVSTIIFVALSMVPYAMVQRAMGSVPRALTANVSFYSYQQVKPFDAVIARFILEWALVTLGAALTLFFLYWFVGLEIRTDKIAQLIGMLILTTAFSFALAFFLSVYYALYKFMQTVIRLMTRALMFLSAVFYPAGHLPSEITAILAYNPIAHLTELTRYYALGLRPFEQASVWYVMMFTLVLAFLGFISYYANRFRLLEKK